MNNLRIKILAIVIIFLIGALVFNQKFQISQKKPQQDFYQIYQSAVNQVLPEQGFKTDIIFGDSMKILVESGVIDLKKFENLYKTRGGISDDMLKILTNGSSEQIVINDKTAPVYLNLFWAIGLSNKTKFNEQSPINGKDLYGFASTGGWNLGKEENGGAYFNKIEVIRLTSEQEKLVLEVAQNTFRPCCDNSTFFQDCNHGSALLGALELAASQGYSREQLYQLSLQLNSFWFSDNYIKTALYFKVFENKDFNRVDPKEIMSFKYSSASGWMENVDKKLQSIQQLKSQNSGINCGTR